MFVYTLWDHRKIHHSEVKNITKFTKRIYYRPKLFSSEKKNQIFMARNYLYIYIIIKRKNNVVAWHLQKSLDARKKLRDK